MKTKAFSKEGLSAAAKLDPKEKAKAEANDFLGSQIDELEQRIEALEAEAETLRGAKKGKKSRDNNERLQEIEQFIERHKWHQGKLELAKRSLMNGGVDTEQINDIKDSIVFYVQEGENPEFQGAEDDTMYDDLNLDEEEDQFGMAQDNDKVSSQDNQSIQDEAPETEGRSSSIVRPKDRGTADTAGSASKKASSHVKSPLPTLATLHTNTVQGAGGSAAASTTGMKPAVAPARVPGEGLKYASAAAAAADKNNVGIAPLPPPPGAHPSVSIAANQPRASATNSPNIASLSMAATSSSAVSTPPKSSEPKTAPTSYATSSNATTKAPSTPKPDTKTVPSRAAGKAPAVPEPSETTKGKPLLEGSSTLILLTLWKLSIPTVSPMVSSPPRLRGRKNRYITCLHPWMTWWNRGQ